MAELLSFLLLSSVHVLAFGGLVVLVLRVTRVRGAAACRLLGLVAAVPVLALLVPLLPVELPLPVLPAEEDGVRYPLPDSAVPANLPPDPEGVPDTVRTASPPSPPPPSERLIRGLAVAWLAIVTMLAVRAGRGLLRLRRRLRTLEPMKDRGVHRLARECAGRVGLARPPRLALLTEGRVPFASGILRPLVAVPTHLVAPGREAELRFALLHEMAHLKRGHCVWIAPELVLGTLYFFHPLMRWALSRLTEEREHLCDLDVTRAEGRTGPYASFLLEEIGKADGRGRFRPLPALRQGTSAMARRVRRLATKGSTTMIRRLGESLTVATAFAALCALLLLTPVPAAAQERPRELDLDHINATATGKPGVYHVMPVFTGLESVKVIKRGGPYGTEHTRVLEEGTDWKFKAKKGKLRVKVKIDDQLEMIVVYGTRVVPWEWRTREPLRAGSVKVLLDDRAGVEGEDFEVDSAKGRIRFLRRDLCTKELHYYISYSFPIDPEKPETSRGGSIGNHPNRKAVRRFLGIEDSPERGSKSGRPERAGRRPVRTDTVGTNASRTDDPRVFTLARAMSSDGMKVAVAQRAKPGDLDWLVRGEDYSYDEARARIVLLKAIGIDKDSEYLFVHGTPARRNVIHFHRPLEEGDVKVIVGDRRLREGKDFQVDYGTGTVTVQVREIHDRDTEFYITAGSTSFGNMGSLEKIRHLLRD